jgi:isopenicillin N synthase-like dioxygenase
MKLPTIDIGPLNGNADVSVKHHIASQLDAACKTFGAFYIVGHGIDSSATLSSMHEFFALPRDEKQRIAVASGGSNRGYIGMGKESGSDALEVKEAYSYGYSWDEAVAPHNQLQGSNIWPDAQLLPQMWKQQMEAFYLKMFSVATMLTKSFSLSFDYPEDHLSDFCKGGETISLMRLFHYYPYTAADDLFPAQQNRIGSSAHTDWGFLTLILQEENVGGLQLYHNGDWHDVQPVSGALVVNCGDYFSLLTGGKYISPKHRVVSEGKERTSAVFFYYPSYDAKIPPLANQDYSLFVNQKENGEAVSPDNLAEFSFGEYIAEKWLQVKR